MLLLLLAAVPTEPLVAEWIAVVPVVVVVVAVVVPLRWWGAVVEIW